MFFNFLGISPQTGIGLLWVIAALCVYLYVKRRNRILAFIIYVIILFHPIAFFVLGNVCLYRNTVFIQISLIWISLLLIIFNRIIKNKNDIVNIVLSVILGIIFTIQFLLVEAGIIHLLILLFYIFIFFLYIFIKKKQMIKKTYVLCIPIILFIISLNAYKFINYRTFGVFDINVRTEGEIGDFTEKVQSIESDTQNKLIWCSIDQLDKAYSVSNTLKEYQTLYDKIRSGFGAAAYVENEGYAGDFVSWGIVNSLISCDIDYIEAKRIFGNINNELDLAFQYGLLKKTDKILLSKTMGRYSLADIEEMASITLDISNHYNKLKNLDQFVAVFLKSKDYNNEYFEYYKIKKTDEYVGYFDLALELIKRYSVINTIHIVVLLTVLILVIINNILSIKNYLTFKTKKIRLLNRINIYSILMISFAALYMLYIFAISGFLIWMVEYYKNDYLYIELLYYNYAATAFVYMLFAFVFADIILIMFIKIALRKLQINKLFEKYMSKIKERFIMNNLYLKYFKYIRLCIVFIFIIIGLVMAKKIAQNDNLYKIIIEKSNEEKRIKDKMKDEKQKIDDLFKENIKFHFDNSVLSKKINYKSELIDSFAIIGDSYGENLYNYSVNNFNHKRLRYAKAGHTVLENYDLYMEALESDAPIILYSFSVNDHVRGTDLKTFKEKTEELFFNALIRNKIIVVHTFMDYYDAENVYNLVDENGEKVIRNKIENYDYVLEKSAKGFENVIYIDCKDLQTNKYRHPDGIHYKYNFYNKFLMRAFDALTKYLKLR